MFIPEAIHKHKPESLQTVTSPVHNQRACRAQLASLSPKMETKRDLTVRSLITTPLAQDGSPHITLIALILAMYPDLPTSAEDPTESIPPQPAAEGSVHWQADIQ
jgi:hypothetical protein